MAQHAFSFVRRFHPSALLPSVSGFLVLTLGADSESVAQARIWDEFSGDKALAHVQRLVDLGPRPPGSEAIEKSRDYIENQLRLSGWQVTQAFTGNAARQDMIRNLIARFRAREARRHFFIVSHYDTKMLISSGSWSERRWFEH
jgi:hypothetical protein